MITEWHIWSPYLWEAGRLIPGVPKLRQDLNSAHNEESFFNELWNNNKWMLIVEKQMYPQSVIGWCEFWGGSIIEPFFFENASDQSVTVNGAHWRDMIVQLFVPELHDKDESDMWFRQDVFF